MVEVSAERIYLGADVVDVEVVTWVALGASLVGVGLAEYVQFVEYYL